MSTKLKKIFYGVILTLAVMTSAVGADEANIVIPREVLEKVLNDKDKNEQNIDNALNVLLQIGAAAVVLILWNRWKKK